MVEIKQCMIIVAIDKDRREGVKAWRAEPWD